MPRAWTALQTSESLSPGITTSPLKGHNSVTDSLLAQKSSATLAPIDKLDNVGERLIADLDSKVLEPEYDRHHDVGLAQLLPEEPARRGQDHLVHVEVLLLANDIQVDEGVLLPHILQSAARLKWQFR